jgi:hypothetical protein
MPDKERKLKMNNSEPMYCKRSFHEAADAGILLWRENFIHFIPIYAIPLWICAFAARFLLPLQHQYFSWLIIWFLKPLFDRLVLHVISIRFFERDASLKRICKNLFKTLTRGLIGDLLWRRFSPLRSSMMPMRVLERNIKSRKETKERKNNLKNGGIDYCFLLTIWGITVEVALLFGGYLFLYNINSFILSGLIPMDSFENIEILLYAMWCINLILIETIYVCMGFSLYINSRISVEGWDLEIIFRNFAEKLKEKSKYIVAVILFLACFSVPVKVYAEEPAAVPLDTLQTILQSPDFGSEENSWNIRMKRSPEDRENRNLDLNWDFLERLGAILSHFLRFVVVGISIGLLIFLTYHFIKSAKNKKNIMDKTRIDIKGRHLLEDPKIYLEKALYYNERGEIRLAWGYCTAAAIQSWLLYRGIIFPPNATENDCANIVRIKTDNSEEANIFGNLIKNWIHLAYAGLRPPDEGFEEAVNLCKAMANSGAENG